MSYHYVYILQSETHCDKFYTGRTQNLGERLKYHNTGKCKYTSDYIPWKIKTAIAFTDRQKAIDFECYLKTQSGRAFAKNRL